MPGPERIRTRTSLPHLVLEQLLFWLCGQGLAERLIDGSYVPGPLMKTMSAHCTLRPEVTLQRALARLRDTAGAAVYLSTNAEGEVSITHYADVANPGRRNCRAARSVVRRPRWVARAVEAYVEGAGEPAFCP